MFAPTIRIKLDAEIENQKTAGHTAKWSYWFSIFFILLLLLLFFGGGRWVGRWDIERWAIKLWDINY